MHILQRASSYILCSANKNDRARIIPPIDSVSRKPFPSRPCQHLALLARRDGGLRNNTTVSVRLETRERRLRFDGDSEHYNFYKVHKHYRRNRRNRIKREIKCADPRRGEQIAGTCSRPTGGATGERGRGTGREKRKESAGVDTFNLFSPLGRREERRDSETDRGTVRAAGRAARIANGIS